MKLDPKTKRTLLRMTNLQLEINRLGDATPMAIFDEYRALLGPMVSEFLPLVNLLIDAGLFTIHVDDDAMEQTRKAEDASFEVLHGFDNGTIWLVADGLAGYTPLKHLSQNN